VRRYRYAIAVVLTTALLGASGISLAQTVRGTRGDDTLVGTPRTDVIRAFEGDDNVYGGQGDDRLYGGAGKDHLWGGDGDDLIIGGPKGDRAQSSPFLRHERIFGGSGDDVIVMRVAGSILFAGTGDDRIDVRDPHSDCKVRPGHGDLDVRGTSGSSRPWRKLDPPHCVNLVLTGLGNNFVRADDGNHDSISCQGRHDRVIVDQYDVALSECDVIRKARR
jgi:hypothetical protein